MPIIRALLATTLWFVLPSSVIAAETANILWPACTSTPRTMVEAAKQMECYTIVRTLIDTSQILHPQFKFCPPKNYTLGQALRIVGKYFDENPSQTHLQFQQIALYALMDAWPCK